MTYKKKLVIFLSNSRQILIKTKPKNKLLVRVDVFQKQHRIDVEIHHIRKSNVHFCSWVLVVLPKKYDVIIKVLESCSIETHF